MAFLSAASGNEDVYSLKAKVATVAGTSAQTLAYLALPPRALARAGQSLRIKAWGKTAANSNTKTVLLCFGLAPEISEGAKAPTQEQIEAAADAADELTQSASSGANNKAWFLEATIQLHSDGSQSALGSGFWDGSALPSDEILVSEFSNDRQESLAVYLTAVDGSDSAEDITLCGMVIEGLSD